MGVDSWASRGEPDAQRSTLDPTFDGSDLGSYASSLGIGSTLDDFATAARAQSRLDYYYELTAAGANDYLREAQR